MLALLNCNFHHYQEKEQHTVYLTETRTSRTLLTLTYTASFGLARAGEPGSKATQKSNSYVYVIIRDPVTKERDVPLGESWRNDHPVQSNSLQTVITLYEPYNLKFWSEKPFCAIIVPVIHGAVSEGHRKYSDAAIQTSKTEVIANLRNEWMHSRAHIFYGKMQTTYCVL